MGEPAPSAELHPELAAAVTKANELRRKLRGMRGELAAQFRKRKFNQKIWQTVIVIAAALSTALASYQVADNTADQHGYLGLGLAIVVAITGVAAAIRDAWQVNESLEDARERYTECGRLLADVDKALFDFEGANRQEDKYKLPPFVRYVEKRVQDVDDDLVALATGKGNSTESGA